MSIPEWVGNANYHAFQMKVESREWRGLSLLGSYSYSKCIDTGSNEGGTAAELLRDNRCVCDFDRPQSLVASYVYSLPVGRGKRLLNGLSGWADQIVGGWEVSGISTFQSGLPFTATITIVNVISGPAPLLETQSAALGNVRTTRAINDLPLNGRNFVQLFHIATGVIPVGGGPTLGPSASNQSGVMGGSVNGARPSNNDFRFDGIQSQDTDQNVLVLLPSADAIQEFKVQTNAMDASFGRNGGGTVNLVIKSGANNVHGTLFEFLRNSALDARNFFDLPRQEARRRGLPEIPPFKLNQFGGSVGGPLRRDRTFFFFDYQGTRIRQAQTYVSTVPIEAFRRGDFSTLPLKLFDPATTRPDPNNPNRLLRDLFPGNIISADRFNPAGKKLVDLYPLPNLPGKRSGGISKDLVILGWTTAVPSA